MTERGSHVFGLRTHHIAIAIIAVVVAVALAANHYLW